MDTFSKIANFLAGISTEEEKAELEAWRKSEPANEEEFLKFQKIWELGTPAASFNPNVDKAWEELSSCLFKEESIQPQKRKGLRIPLFLKQPAWQIAAAVSLLLLSALAFFMLNPTLPTSQSAAQVNVKTSSIDKQEVTLSDGTQIWLNKKSSIRYPEQFTLGIREVFLEGEAYFEVKSMPEKPFIIHAGAGKVEVLGTAFNLRTKERQNVKLQVMHGRVKFSIKEQAGTAIELGAGEAAELLDKEIKTLKANINSLSWKTGEFVFEDNSVEEVFQALESFYPVQLKTTDPQLLKCRLSARFKQQTLEEVLNVLDITLNLRHSSVDNKEEIVFTFAGNGPHCAGGNF